MCIRLSPLRTRSRQLASLWVAVLLIPLACAWASAEQIQLGMSQDEVVQLLGEPDRKAVLVGKVLREIEKVPEVGLAQARLVYVFDTLRLQVWFKDGKVTGVTRDGVSTQ